MARLSICLLGPFAAELDGERLSGFRSDKVRALLAYLAVEDHRPWMRTTLAGLLWPDFPEQAAQSNLRNALSNLRHVIGEHQAHTHFLRITRTTLQFNLASDSWLDLKELLDLVPKSESKDVLPPGQADIVRLERGLALYQGDFMEGFSIDSAAFEEWLLATREQAHRKVLQILRMLVLAHERSGELAVALEHTQRWIALEPWDEAAHRHRMRIWMASGNRSAALAQYEECCQRLAEDLGIEPEPETVQLYEKIRGSQIKSSPHRFARSPAGLEAAASDPGPLPQFLAENANLDFEPKVFVARQKELRKLEYPLERAVEGKGSVCFVTGEPGSGKTSLLAEFSRRAMDKYPGLLVFWGQCNAYTGHGDPFFSFMNITRMFAGEVDPLLTGSVITLEHAQRLWKYLPETFACLADYGPELIRRFLSGGDKLSLVRLRPGIAPELIDRFEAQIKSQSKQHGGPRAQQAALLEEFAQVVSAIARSHTLILVLDDLQWIDPGSIDLLFHLGRRLAGNKILLLGAFRTEEVLLGREGKPHPLAGVVQELQAVYGEILLDLMRSDGFGFVEALLDSEPNEIGPEFRRMLYRHTSGQPLFTIELLRGMQLRGEIVRSKQGKWIAGSHLNWETLPARVEAVIARRINHLPEECQELLNVACVEGEQFTGQVLARVLDKNEAQVQNLLSKEVCKRHRLASALGVVQIGQQRLSHYRFWHSLFQIYLYNHLDAVEKARLHGKVARELEAIYMQKPDKLPETAHTLARHFETANVTEKAVHYYTLAGKNAQRLSASREALDHFYHALHLLNSLPASLERDQQELELQLSLGPALTALKGWAPPEMAAAYARAQELCQNLSDHVQLIPVLWLLAIYRLGRSEHAEVDRLVERLVRLAKQADDPALLCLASLQVSSFYQGNFILAKEQLERTVTWRDLAQQILLAQQYGLSPKVVGLAYLANCLWVMGFADQAERYSQEACELAEKMNHPMTSGYALARSCWLEACNREMQVLQDQAGKLLQVAQKYGFRNFELAGIFFREWVNVQRGISIAEGIEQMHQVFEDYHTTGTVLNRTAFLVFFGQACCKAGQVERGLAAIDESIALGDETGERWFEAEAYRQKGELLAQRALNSVESETSVKEVENCLRIALRTARQQGALALELRAATSLSHLWQCKGKSEAGWQLLVEVYGKFVEGWDTEDLRIAKELLDNSLPVDQAGFWTERWQQMECKAQADIDAGRVRNFENVDEALEALRKLDHAEDTVD